MSLRATAIARGLSQLILADPRAGAASARFLRPAGPPARHRCGRTWRASLVAGGLPSPFATAAALAAFPGTTLPPISNISGRHCGDGSRSRQQPSGATCTLLASVAFLSLTGCKDEHETKAWCMPKKGGNKSRPKSVKKSFAPKHALKSIAAKHGAKGGSRRKTDSLSFQAPVINQNDRSDRAFDMVSGVLISTIVLCCDNDRN